MHEGEAAHLGAQDLAEKRGYCDTVAGVSTTLDMGCETVPNGSLADSRFRIRTKALG
jgi:hypothetical protein